jgi:CheY-like chemotaxis protein
MSFEEKAADDVAEVHTVLVAEDEVLVRMAVSEYLRDCGYRVIEASNGDEAVAFLRTDAHVDVVFTDVTMPGMNGFDLSRWVRCERPEVHVILTSGATKASREAADLYEDGPVMGKPYDHGEVERRIRALLARRKV